MVVATTARYVALLQRQSASKQAEATAEPAPNPLPRIRSGLSSPEFEIARVSCREALVALRGDWETLESSLAHADSNGNIDQFRTVVQTLGGIRDPHVLTLVQYGIPAAI